ncbi:4825_t:CDS:2 [Gigaspora margarita]|uniref:4825_t:CDS:1 n=1 Tax=Gigaspora margarita TaxID=4874 RepID=A0ABN7X4D0_GIGMA|nr:4825_t:CDS:2 [Gigaspora margarita]
MAREDNYDQLQLLLSSLLEPIPHNSVKEIWKLQEPKQKYRLRIGYTKKALDLAIWANRVEEFVSHLKNFIEVTKTNLFSTQDSTSVKDPL